MVESNNYWRGVVNGVNSEEFDILNILDFPMESLEGDGIAGDLDPSHFQNMGPIPLDILTGVPLIPQGHVANASKIKGSSRNAPINMKSERIELGNCAGYKNCANTAHESFISPSFKTFRTPSPVSILESGGSISSGKLLTTKPGVLEGGGSSGKLLSTKPEILESGVSCSSGKHLTMKPDTVIPGGAPSKRKRPSNLHPSFKIGSVANRISHSGNNEDFRKQRFSDSSNILEGLEYSSHLARKNLREGFCAVEEKRTLDKQSASSKKCAHCQVRKTPLWREGPLGPRTLCNACGVRYRSGRLLPEYRPASSPTFVPSVHSNSHKKVIEMRKKASQQDIKPGLPPMSRLPKFAPVSLKDEEGLENSSNILEGLENCSRARKKLREGFCAVEKKRTLDKLSASSKKCAHCQVRMTPLWREGPLGLRTLCNACGVRYRSGRLLPEYRPASSPTFVPSVHANSHKKVIEKRKKATQQDVEPGLPPMSRSPEFVPVSLKDLEGLENSSNILEGLENSSNILEGLENSSHLTRKNLREGFCTVEKTRTLDKQSASSKKCAHCQVRKTPQWREGPLGPSTLCNACGVRYRSGRLLPEYRPASSPTFVPSVHSNSHKKVIEMRKKATQQDIEPGLPPMSRSPEFVPVSLKLPEYRPASSPTFVPSVHSNSHKKVIEMRKKASQQDIEPGLPPMSRLPEFVPVSLKDLEGLENSSHRARKNLREGFCAVEKKKSASSKKCAHCQVRKTPLWREGPLGPRTLCNACGVRYRSGRLLPEYRPASSPTFVPSVHSNSHKKVIEMRKKATLKDIESGLPPMSPSPEFVPVSNNLFDPLC